jgi:hypothetical protein
VLERDSKESDLSVHTKKAIVGGPRSDCHVKSMTMLNYQMRGSAAGKSIPNIDISSTHSLKKLT